MVLASSRGLASALLLITAAPILAMPHIHRGPTAAHAVKAHARAAVEHHATTPVLTIAPARATQIQTALIRSGYMTGEPSGVWDANTQSALARLQSENGWQTKFVPDSRAIIKLGLGPGTETATGIQEANTFSSNQ